MEYHGLNQVTSLLSDTVADMLELQYQLESKTANWYATIDINSELFFSLSGGRETTVCFYLGGAFSIPGINYPRGGNTALAFVMG